MNFVLRHRNIHNRKKKKINNLLIFSCACVSFSLVYMSGLVCFDDKPTALQSARANFRAQNKQGSVVFCTVCFIMIILQRT
jgi:hypothetical protein